MRVKNFQVEAQHRFFLRLCEKFCALQKYAPAFTEKRNFPPEFASKCGVKYILS
jgi:hypothetical protein